MTEEMPGLSTLLLGVSNRSGLCAGASWLRARSAPTQATRHAVLACTADATPRQCQGLDWLRRVALGHTDGSPAAARIHPEKVGYLEMWVSYQGAGVGSVLRSTGTY